MLIDINKPILELNDQLAAENRTLLAKSGIFMLDLMASPGAGKTSLILATIECLREKFRIAVIEGDVASDIDAQLIKSAGITAVQINTGGACHLDSAMTASALSALPMAELDLIIVENVGNLVCPNEFDLGENARVVILSVPEGFDKPYKYPGVFTCADAVILSKIDAMPVFDFDQDAFTAAVHSLNPTAPIFPVSAKTMEGINEWSGWVGGRIRPEQFTS
jgi:hydrogenase nickel incorporation protein HypB